MLTENKFSKYLLMQLVLVSRYWDINSTYVKYQKELNTNKTQIEDIIKAFLKQKMI
jgi:hypothetical protein